MIKNWQKWVVCVFSVIFVSMIFVFDAMFLTKDKVDLSPPIEIEDNNQPPVTPNENEDVPIVDEEPIITPAPSIPSYANGYICLEDALTRFNQSTNYTWKFASSANSLGIIQNVQGTKQLKGTNYFAETRAYCDSSLGQRWYEQINSTDMSSYYYIKTNKIDANLNYDIDGITPTKYTKEQLMNLGKEKLEVFLLKPQKGIDKLAKFDRDSSKAYYIISFVLNVDKLPSSYVDAIKKESGASSVKYKSARLTYYVSKSTGNIEKYEQDEIYTMTMGISLDVTYKYIGQLKVN